MKKAKREMNKKENKNIIEEKFKLSFVGVIDNKENYFDLMFNMNANEKLMKSIGQKVDSIMSKEEKHTPDLSDEQINDIKERLSDELTKEELKALDTIDLNPLLSEKELLKRFLSVIKLLSCPGDDLENHDRIIDIILRMLLLHKQKKEIDNSSTKNILSYPSSMKEEAEELAGKIRELIRGVEYICEKHNLTAPKEIEYSLKLWYDYLLRLAVDIGWFVEYDLESIKTAI